MKHTIERTEGASIIVLQGDLWGGSETCDLQTRIKADVTRLISEGERRFVLDLNQTHRINSIGLGVLVSTHASIRNAGGDLKLCSVDPRPRATFEITGLLHLFQIYKTREEAVRAFRAPV